MRVHLRHHTAFDVVRSQDLEDLDSTYPCPEEEPMSVESHEIEAGSVSFLSVQK